MAKAKESERKPAIIVAALAALGTVGAALIAATLGRGGKSPPAPVIAPPAPTTVTTTGGNALVAQGGSTVHATITTGVGDTARSAAELAVARAESELGRVAAARPDTAPTEAMSRLGADASRCRSDFAAGRFAEAAARAESVVERLRALEIESSALDAKRVSAKAALDAASEAMRASLDPAARRWLPGRSEAAERLFAAASSDLAAGRFDECRARGEECRAHAIETGRIRQGIGLSAAGRLDITVAVPEPGSANEIDRVFASARESARELAGAVIRAERPAIAPHRVRAILDEWSVSSGGDPAVAGGVRVMTFTFQVDS